MADDLIEIALNIIYSSDEDEAGPPRRRPRIIRERMEHFDDMDETDFAKRFRLTKESGLKVLDLINHRLKFRTFEKNQSVSPTNQLLLCMRFYATGSTQLSATDFSGVSQPTACRIIHRVKANIASLYRQFTYFPRTETKITTTQQDFYQIARFPRVIGALDCTHIKIRSPGGENADFRNRKCYFSINCQAISNANLEILDLVARWPGSSYDATIFDQCRQRTLLEQQHYGDCIILGDSAYTCHRYLMVPLHQPNPAIPEEVSYNESQIRTRNPIERVFGVWKRRFPILAFGINTDVRNTLPIIVATGVLFNIIRRGGDPLPPDVEQLALPMPWDELISEGQVQHQVNPGRTQDLNPYRAALINNYFRTLHDVFGNRD